MTTITGTLLIGGGISPHEAGKLAWIAVEVVYPVFLEGGELLLPEYDPVYLNEQGFWSVDVEPLPAGHAYRITAVVAGGAYESTRIVTVPASGTVDYEDLLDVVLPGVPPPYEIPDWAQRGVAGGVAGLDGDGDVIDAGGAKLTPHAHANLSVLAATTASFTTADETKLDGVSAGATANATNAELRDRTTHTGTQSAATISDFTEAVQDAVGAFFGAGTGAAVTYDDAANTITVSATGTSDPEAVRDAIGAALVGVGNITVTVNDAGDTITVSTTATVNATDAALRDRATHTGTQSADTLTDGTTNKVFLATERTKLAGIATGATVNAADADLRDRTTHTGTQPSTTISDFTEAVQDALAGVLVAGTNVTLTYDDVANTLTVAAIGGGGGGLDAEAVRDTIGAALIGAGNITVTVNDGADTITIGTTATANATDAALRDRTTHTGVQPISTVTDLQAALDAKATPADITAATAAEVARADAAYLAKANNARNILDYGVTRGTTASQTVAIKTALDAHPGEAFYFPPGDYRLDTALTVSASNSLILAEGARIYAGAALGTLITYDPDILSYEYAEDKAIIGGLLDGNLLANRCLSINQVMRFTLTRTTFRNAINRGLVTGPVGAEIIAYDLRFYNTTVTNVADNIAIEAGMGDCHFRDIVIRDWTVGVKDVAANRWDRVHPWIGPDMSGAAHMTQRYPTSIGFDITGMSDLVSCLSDTYRTGFFIRSNGTAYTAPPRLVNCRASWSASTLSSALAAANPAYVLDNTGAVGALVDGLNANGHSTTAPANFLNGTAALLNARNSFSYGYVNGVGDYRGGIQQGTFTFTPTFYGSTGAGTHTYGTRSGRIIVSGDSVTYLVRIQATLDATTAFAGALRVGGLIIPPGATNVRDGAGSVGWSNNARVSGAVIFAGTAPYVTLLDLGASGTGEVDIPGQALRGKVIDLMFSVTTTHFKA